MIIFKGWNIQVSGMIARQYDNLSRRLEVIGDLPEGWEWAMLVKVDGAQDIIYLEPMAGGAGVTLTRDQLALAGYYSLQLRGTQGDVVRHTNITQTFVPESLTGTGQWPSVPSEFLQVEQRILELNQHPPIPGEDGFWQIWNPDTDQYETSAFPLPEGGSGGGVTAAGIRDALGYTPANEAAVSRLSEENEEIKKGINDLSTEIETKVTMPALPSEGKLREYAALFNRTKDVESFLFFADPHLVNKTTLSEIKNDVMGDLQTIRNYYASTPTSFALCTGDWIDDGYDGDEACFLIGIVRALWKRWFDGGCFVVGNHEYNDCGTELLDTKTVHNLLLPYEANNYYTYDGAKTKFYVLDTGLLGYGITEYGWEQIDWLANKLLECDAEHSAIASHIWYVADTDGTLVLTPFADAVLRLAQAYNDRNTITLSGKAYDFATATGFVEFAIGGHKHVDKVAEEYGIPVILTTNVTIAGYGRPTFDLVLVNYTERKIDFIRVGSYSSRTVMLAARGGEEDDVVTYTNLVPTAVSIVTDEIYNGVGYKNNTVRSGSAEQNYERNLDGYVLTGIIDCYIPMYDLNNLPTIYIKGNIETDNTEYSSIVLWMDGKVRKGVLSSVREMNPGSGFVVDRLADGYYKMTPTVLDDGRLKIQVGMGSGDVTGIQVNLKGTGEGMIVTVNEPIE